MKTCVDFVPPEIVEVIRALEDRHYETVLVGGCVRNHLLGLPVVDFDLATAATPDVLLKMFPRAIPTGLRHGTVTLPLATTSCEVTTFREEGGYSDGRHPDSVHFTKSLAADLMRRDFTVNAMALRLSGDLVDPLQGRTDLQQRTLRAVGRPVDRMAEDGLRILRAFRLAAQYELDIHDDTFAAMLSVPKALTNIAMERIGRELLLFGEGNWPRLAAQLAEGRWLVYADSDRETSERHHAAEILQRALQECTDSYQTMWKERAGSLGAVHRQWTALTLWTSIGGGSSGEVVEWLKLRKMYAKTVARTLQLSLCPMETWSWSDWHTALYEQGWLITRLAVTVRSMAQNLNYHELSSRAVVALRTQPLWRRTDLPLRGQDVQAWTQRTGPEIGDILDWVVTEVLSGRLDGRSRSSVREAVTHSFRTSRESVLRDIKFHPRYTHRDGR
ncbi:MAG: hypothetical protein OWQ59_07025 [Alicyclobacillaceae bacterium]|uniref:CCA tRNA nucleotidyltransferase n=1 Tax=Alicyclobacillus sp. SP_1 TaxID=2942475 RepID=UPI002157BF2E|nr:hypothetical protein [Alicyclobacillus sp. SP_1]MCY0888197.1 hypothetical protein [Alicyclobacillaceae bacterium]